MLAHLVFLFPHCIEDVYSQGSVYPESGYQSIFTSLVPSIAGHMVHAQEMFGVTWSWEGIAVGVDMDSFILSLIHLVTVEQGNLIGSCLMFAGLMKTASRVDAFN